MRSRDVCMHACSMSKPCIVVWGPGQGEVTCKLRPWDLRSRAPAQISSGHVCRPGTCSLAPTSTCIVLPDAPQRKAPWHAVHRIIWQPPSFMIAAPQCGHGRQPLAPSMRSGRRLRTQLTRPASMANGWEGRTCHVSNGLMRTTDGRAAGRLGGARGRRGEHGENGVGWDGRGWEGREAPPIDGRR